jgi:hypothetical protein
MDPSDFKIKIYLYLYTFAYFWLKLLSKAIHIDMAFKNTTMFCNIQGASVYTNVSANYMFRSPLIKPSSGWIQLSQELYNNAI